MRDEKYFKKSSFFFRFKILEIIRGLINVIRFYGTQLQNLANCRFLSMLRNNHTQKAQKFEYLSS